MQKTIAWIGKFEIVHQIRRDGRYDQYFVRVGHADRRYNGPYYLSDAGIITDLGYNGVYSNVRSALNAIETYITRKERNLETTDCSEMLEFDAS